MDIFKKMNPAGENILINLGDNAGVCGALALAKQALEK